MELYDQVRETWGQTVIIPLAQYIRFTLEGENAPRTPLAEVRFLEEKNAPLFDPVSIGAALVIGLILTALEPPIRRLMALVSQHSSVQNQMFTDYQHKKLRLQILFILRLQIKKD